MIIQAAAVNPDKQIRLPWYCFSVLSDGAMTTILFTYSPFYANLHRILSQSQRILDNTLRSIRMDQRLIQYNLAKYI